MSTSPQWDSRNRGFIPPAELHELQRTSAASPVNRDFHSPDSQPQDTPSSSSMPSPSSPHATPAARPPQHATHTRSSSFFSFLKSNNEAHAPASTASGSLPPRRATAQIPSDEHGRMRPSLDNSAAPSTAAQKQDPPPPPAQERRGSQSGPGGLSAFGPQPSELHPEIRSAVTLTIAHAHKIYFSGPLVRRIERLPDGHRPTKDEGWRDVWAQLGGTTLSVWDMKEIEEASKRGQEVPPTYINITDAFVQVLGSVTIPSTDGSPPQKRTNVVTVNSAGSNLLLFACPDTTALISWATAFRLAAWEKSRLEEIYTAHLLRITFNGGREVPTTLVRGKMEGWVRLRMAGQTDWKRLWMALDTSALSPEPQGLQGPEQRSGSPSAPRRKRISSLFGSRDDSASASMFNANIKPLVLFYNGPKGKDRKKPFLTFSDVTQAFAVYPERPELISRSTLIKIEGAIGDEEVAGGMKGRQGWVLIMPELEHGVTQAKEMLKWVVAIHDTFHLYGRPTEYNWDPRDPISMMFAYPVGPKRDLLFLEREMAESMDPRDDRTSAVRSRLLQILLDRAQGFTARASTSGPPTLPPLPSMESNPQDKGEGSSKSFQLPPLNFDSSKQPEGTKRNLSPITESSGPDSKPASNSPHTSADAKTVLPPLPSTVPEESNVKDATMLDKPMNTSPTSLAHDIPLSPVRRPSEDSVRLSSESKPGSRSGSKLGQSFTGSFGSKRKTSTDDTHSVDPAKVQLPMSPESRARSFGPSPPPIAPPLTPTVSSEPSSVVIAPPRTPSPGFSILTSPHSMLESPKSGPGESIMAFAEKMDRARGTSTTPPLSTPRSITASLPPTPSKLSQPPAVPPQEREEDDDLYKQAGALYYMQQFHEDTPKQPLAPRRQPPPPLSPGDDDDEEEDSSGNENSPVPLNPPAQATITPLRTKSPTSPPRPAGGRAPPVAHRSPPQSPRSVLANPYSPTAEAHAGAFGMGRRPSGARAPPGNMRVVSASNSVHSPEPRSAAHSTPDSHHRQETNMSHEDSNADALAALNFLEQDEEPQQKPAPPAESAPLPQPVINEPEGASADGSHSPVSDAASQYKSSFAPSKKAMERKANAEAQQAAHEAAVTKPGRANGAARVKSKGAGAWGDSSEEEEEEEEEDDDDVDSDGERPKRMEDRPGNLQANPQARQQYPPNRGPSPGGQMGDPSYAQGQLRGPRTLPQVPGQRPQVFDEDPQAPVPRRLMPDQYPRSVYDDSSSGGPMRPPSGRPQSEYPNAPPTAQYAAARAQNMWSQVLDPGHTPGAPPPENGRDTFVQIEAPSQTMTKAFTPHGLLSAGLQDKQDRSAKKQEELARETGASLINVQAKPPPPQTGLLGAITAHERDRKREGGVGATLTEREREKRLAEERQRKLDEYQRQQLDQMAQGGSVYGMPQFPGYNPMMNPMMMGMNPMMTGGYMGYPGMMPGYNPQQMFAAQQAAQAYQQAMMTYSQAGSQIGGEGGGPAPLNPMMTGASMGGFDPRFSMMGMQPMMNPMAMGGGGLTPNMTGGGMAGGGMMGGGMMGGMNPMGMQMTGGAGFDPRMSQFDPGMQAGNPDFSGQGRLSAQNNFNGPPSAQPSASGEDVPRNSANASPRPPPQ
ncbi:hypothetical protein DENSPDRAFT_877486 [Dentipellis sp. KUC8613]|nr:hypothetical protein DENSPDRAFT_877486 [Dentipellis sp. KUC8613]